MNDSSIMVGAKDHAYRASFSNSPTFMPDDDPARIDKLLECVERQRYSKFFAVYMELEKMAPKACADTGFSDSVLDIMGLPTEHRIELVNDPAFQIWLNRTFVVVNGILTGATNDEQLLTGSLLEFSAMRRRFDDRKKDKRILRVPRTGTLVQRFDIDPLIASATPPSYEFPSDMEKRQHLEREGYSLAFFKDLVTIALERISETWPECCRQFKRLVKVIGYIPDATFRSCSASRYTGVIYLATKDSSMLDIEESLVHEAGHQLLYNIVEVNAVNWDDTPDDEMYTLPWSGRQRDFYGYFHAFYIYVLLVKYFEKVNGRSEEEQMISRRRMVFILRGLVRALPDFEGNRNFTPHGTELFQNLRNTVRELEENHRHLLKEIESPIALKVDHVE